jgi:hypothetical protein
MSIQPGVGYTFNASSQGSNLTILQPWFPYVPTVSAQDVAFTCSPFKVHDIVEVTEGESTYVTYEICPGTINNRMPQVYNTVSEEWEYLDDLTEDYQLICEFTAGECWVVLRVGPSTPPPGDFPPTAPAGGADDPYPRIYTQGTDPAGDDSDLYGYVTIAKITEVGGGVYTIDQYITGSLWGDRLKLGDIVAKYYYARI